MVFYFGFLYATLEPNMQGNLFFRNLLYTARLRKPADSLIFTMLLSVPTEEKDSFEQSRIRKILGRKGENLSAVQPVSCNRFLILSCSVPINKKEKRCFLWLAAAFPGLIP
jgi:hypothetical protein